LRLRRAGRIWLLPLAVALGAVAAAPSGASQAPGGPSAVAAGSLAFDVNSNLHLVGRPGHVLNEQGTFSGSQSGTIALRFTSVTSTSGEASFTAYSSKGGSVSGRTATKGRVVGATVYLSGSMTITGGTGRWAHASGRNIVFSGVVDRQNFHATTHMQGSIKI
jgi:hypothetical protein